MRTLLAAASLALISCGVAQRPAPGRVYSLAPLKPSAAAYPLRVDLLSHEEREGRARQLEAKNPGWRLVLDGLGYLNAASGPFNPTGEHAAAFAGRRPPRWYARAKLPDVYLQRVRDFVARNRELLAAEGGLERLRVLVELHRTHGRPPSWSLRFDVWPPVTLPKDRDHARLHAALVRGREILVTEEHCPPCQPGGDCKCFTTTLLRRPASPELTRLNVATTAFYLQRRVELRRVAWVLPDDLALARTMPNGKPATARVELSPRSQQVDAVNGDDLAWLYRARQRDRTYPKQAPGIWVRCPGCNVLDLRGPH